MNIIRIRNNNLNDNTLLHKKEQTKKNSGRIARRQAGVLELGRETPGVCLSRLSGSTWTTTRRFTDQHADIPFACGGEYMKPEFIRCPSLVVDQMGLDFVNPWPNSGVQCLRREVILIHCSPAVKNSNNMWIEKSTTELQWSYSYNTGYHFLI